ncbi:MAG: right-handed parallel beta-helix repeat-containing protein [Limnochordia bacterium]|nr:right-handed parallel beta-helix repeat-containing protein [Bacillota bacterium]NLH30472.1 right-handed parallel beta-helix repeat-containing protein [Bacillota bacterium]HOB08356.1 right-handed parallel beta-helix repeat-containing protein [Limnochordia bacterium]HPZ30620.1 right-handed parallel beta-helix repeat-containing protein [Limnochordia bacterium]HQD70275.1 right-handed parallel beta-helix repeat-containing protein [Limnochordia bacterium]
MRHVPVAIVLLVLAVVLAAMPAWVMNAEGSIQAVFFVSPEGNDANPGTIDRPFATIERARDAVREINRNMTGDIIVYLRDGTYRLERTLEFDERDSGTNGYRVIYQAYPGESPIISGGVPVTGWEQHDGSIYKASLERGGKLRALYVNGQRAVMARKEVTAQGGYGSYRIREGEADWAWADAAFADGVRYRFGDLPEIAHPEDLEITTSSTWNLNLVTVREQIRAGVYQVLLLQQPYGAIAQSFGWGTEFKVSGPQVLHNAYEFLDQPGEFYYDKTTHTLYYYKHPDEDLASSEVIAPMVEGLVKIKGASRNSRVENISFIGLTFAHSDWNLVAIGDSRGQATLQGPTAVIAMGNQNWHFDIYRAFDVPGAAVDVENSRGIVFERNTIKHTGNIGLAMRNDVLDSRIIGSRILDTAGSAIVIGHPQHVYEGDGPMIKHAWGVGPEKEKYPPDVEGVPRRIEINNNYIDGAGVLFHGQNAIMAFFVEDLRITHNLVMNIPYGPISVGWSWWNFNGDPDSILPGIPTRTQARITIHNNRLIDYGLTLTDTGAIYLLAAMPNSTVNGNYVVASPKYMLNAVHPDEGTSGVTGRDNVFDIGSGNNFELNDWGRKHDVHFDNTYTTSRTVHLGAPNVSVTNLKVHSDAIWPLEALAIIENSGLEPEYMDLAPLSELMFVADARAAAGAQVPVKFPKEFRGSIWFAPMGTTSFQPSAAMAQADLASGVIHAPQEAGRYKLYAVDDQGRIVMESQGTLHVTAGDL